MGALNEQVRVRGGGGSPGPRRIGIGRARGATDAVRIRAARRPRAVEEGRGCANCSGAGMRPYPSPDKP
jgi:hypothetical protein